MSRAGLLVPGATIQQAKDRARGKGFGVPSRLLIDSADTSVSARQDYTFTGGAANTLGSWVEIVAALSADVGWVAMWAAAATAASGIDSSMLFNLGVGGAGSEVTLIEHLGIGWCEIAVATASDTLPPNWLFPIWIPKGSRVAGRVQSKRGAVAGDMAFQFYAAEPGMKPSNKITALGADTANSRGTVMAVPGSANVKGAWTQIIAATAEPYTALGVSVQGGGDTTQATTRQLIDIGIGAAGAEQVLIGDIGTETSATEGVMQLGPQVFGVYVPKGARLAARWQGATLTGNIDVHLHGIRPPT